ncbi:alpha-hydroxyketone-type quorum-sensing autoinducer synthase [Vibrio sp. 10N.261.55.A7]|uniref:alpha-hydroxyketone-type quorum-sensing autoinducer synthase n=1 Tax=Vibrio sp. 10N.261.55.A7 TaxID=1880851 RepID=UPI000C82C893|nr:alpha-hydroxyketone-type quorum-sensing autoinducer synthase [Vibrio sp. 10N.261.55.A7]PMJ97190.1 CAI-1 autoinducer synthase [Vibrio sp. 10N.261.55.A7]
MKYRNKKSIANVLAPQLKHGIEELILPKNKGRNLVLGRKPKSGDIVLQSNDYLAIGRHHHIIDSQIDALKAQTSDSFMSNVFLHGDGTNQSVEQELATFAGFEYCTIAPSGWIANTALMQTICNSTTQVYIDFFTHMSLWEGARYAGANIHPFMHNNPRHLKRLIQKHGPGVIVVDSVYSTLGTIAPLVDIVQLSKQFDCASVIDESHSLGTHGPKGAGLLQEFELSNDVDFMTASLAKTFAYRAGAIWCNNQFGETLPYEAYSSIFSSAMMVNELERIRATLKVVKESNMKRTRLFSHSQHLASSLREIGFNIRSESQIISLETGDSNNTINVRNFLEQHGVLGSVFCTPATPNNKNLIRFSVHSDMKEHEVLHVVQVCEKAFRHPELNFY